MSPHQGECFGRRARTDTTALVAGTHDGSDGFCRFLSRPVNSTEDQVRGVERHRKLLHDENMGPSCRRAGLGPVPCRSSGRSHPASWPRTAPERDAGERGPSRRSRPRSLASSRSANGAVSRALRHTSASHTSHCCGGLIDALAASIAMHPVVLLAPLTWIDGDRIVPGCTLAFRNPLRYLDCRCEGRRVVERTRVPSERARPAGHYQFAAGCRE